MTRFVEVFQNGLPASDTLWAYAEKMAKPYGIQVPPPLRANRDWLVRWIDHVRKQRRTTQSA